MTLKEIFDALNAIAMRQPNINQYEKSGDVYDLNSDRNAKFGVFCATQAVHTHNFEDGTITYNWYLFVIDRLKSDSSNKIDVQSTAIQSLSNILKTFANEYEDDATITDASYDVFTERFTELCAGAYATVAITVDDNNCLELF